MSDLARSMLLSVRVASLATVVAALVAIPLAWWLARRRFAGKTAVETVLTLPLVLPPTVVGYGLIVLLGRTTPGGHIIQWAFGSGVMFTVSGAVMAAAVVALPLLYLPARAAFATVEPELEDVARLFGANTLQTIWHVSLPMARRGIGSGLLLGFARALGEFGATVMVFGIQEHRQTLPILIYQQSFETGGMDRSALAVVVMVAISLLVILLYNRSSAAAPIGD